MDSPSRRAGKYVAANSPVKGVRDSDATARESSPDQGLFSLIEETVTIARETDLPTRNDLRHSHDVTKISRRGRDYDLPVLTFEEAARVLGVEAGRLMMWTMEKLRPSQSQWSLWTRGKRELPEALIRLYLTDRVAGGR